MAYRPPFGYNPGLQQGQQQQPIPGQMMQTPQPYHPGAGMMQQGYQMPGQGGMVMAPGMYYPSQQMMMQQGFVPAGMMAAGPASHQQVQQMAHPQQQIQQQPQTEEDKKRDEKVKRERYFQEQKMKLQQFGKGAKPGLSLDMASSLVDSLGGSTKPSPAQGSKPAQRKPGETDSFGDFQHASGSQPVQQQQHQEEEEDDFGDFLQARPKATATAPPQDPGDPPMVQESPAEAPTPAPQDNPVPEQKQEISLEHMMMMSTDLSEATKSAKPIHVKKTLKDVTLRQSATKASSFAASNKSRTWSSHDNFSSLFMVGKRGVTPAAVQGTGEGVVGAQPQMPVPEWCANPAAPLPLVYQQVYQATYQNGAIQTESLYPILLMSGLDRQALGVIWNMVNKTQPGVLEKQELICALGLIALHQNKLPVTLESLFALKEAPVPTISPHQVGAQNPMAAHQPVAPGTDNGTLAKEQASGSTLEFSDSVSSFTQSVAKERETFNAQFDREDHTPEDHTLTEYKTHQPEVPPSNSLEEEFAEFQSSRDLQVSNKPSPVVSIPAPNTVSPFNLPTSSKPTKSATSPNLQLLSETNSDVDLEFGDFSSHRATQPASTTESPFGNFQTPAATGSGDQWAATFQHASSEPSLLSNTNANEDRYAVFKIFDDQPSGEDSFGSKVTPPSQTLEDSDDDGGSALRGMVSESSDEEPFSNFQVASIPPEYLNQGNPQGPSISDISNGMFSSAANVIKEEDFGDFVGLRDAKDEPEKLDAIMFGDSPITNNKTGGGTVLPSALSFLSSTKQGVDSFGSFDSKPPAAGSMDGFGSFESKPPATSGVDSFGSFESMPPASGGMDSFGSFESMPPAAGGVNSLGSFGSMQPAAGGLDKYGAFKDLQFSVEEKPEVEDEDFGDFHAVEPSSQSSKDSLSSGLEDKLHNGVPGSGNKKIVLSMELPSNNFSLPIGKEVSKPPPIHPGLEGPPLLLSSDSIIGGDRYAEVAGDKLDDNRHVTAWEHCLTSCHSAIKVANDVLNNSSSSSVCKQVTSSRSGSDYFKAIVEIYRVACRVYASIKARGVETDILVKLNDEIEKTWTNLSAFLSASPLQIDNGSFVFKTATLRPEPENQDKACGVCLLNVDARSKAFNRSEDSLKLSYGGRQYHATCANLWVNMVDSILPALPLEALL